MRIIAVALSPVTPSLSLRIYTQLGFSKDQFEAVRWVFFILSPYISIKYLKMYDMGKHKLCKRLVPCNLMCFVLQNDTKWGGLKAGQIMADPKPIFARIEIKKEGEDEVPRNAVKDKKKTKNQGLVEA